MVARGGLGLGGILIIGGVLYFSNAGTWMWNGIKQLNQQCYSLVSQTGTSIGTPVCNGLSRGVAGLEQFGNTIRTKLDSVGLRSMDAVHIGGLGSMGDQVAALASPSGALTRMMQDGPHVSSAGSVRQQFQQAIDSYTIGQNYLADGENPGQGVAWLQQGAAQPQGYGVLSQLALGNLYSTGSGEVAANPAQALNSYKQASTSLSLLEASNNPQAQQLLQALPMSAQEMKVKLDQAMAQLQRGMR